MDKKLWEKYEYYIRCLIGIRNLMDRLENEKRIGVEEERGLEEAYRILEDKVGKLQDSILKEVKDEKS